MLTKDQLNEAFAQILSFTENEAELQKQGSGYTDYLIVRGIIRALGYEEHTDQIINEIAHAGFTYCMDPQVAANVVDGVDPSSAFPSEQVCYWMPDQLLSRLESIKNNFNR